MRTTISVNDRLLRQAKRLSVERGCPLGEVVDEALRLAFAQDEEGAGVAVGGSARRRFAAVACCRVSMSSTPRICCA